MQNRVERLVHNVEAWGDAFPPACACGCGEPVRHKIVGGFNKYINLQHQAWDLQAQRSEQITEIWKFRRGDNIPIEDFRRAVFQIKDKKGWRLNDMAQTGGVSRGWLMSYLYDKRVKSIGRQIATDFLRRLAGLASPPSSYQLRVAPLEIESHNRAVSSRHRQAIQVLQERESHG